MTRRILTTLAAFSFVLLAFASPHSAQERQVGNRTPIGDRSQGNRQVVDVSEAEKLRSDLITAYEESEALVKFLAGYDFIRQSNAMEGYETACQKLETERVRIQQMPVAELMLQANNLPDAKSLRRIIEVSRSTRTDVKLQEAIQKVERYSQAGMLARNSSSGKGANSRGTIASPAYIPPICNHDDPSNYPSGADIAIPNAIGLALHAIADSLPGILGFFISVPDPVRIALVIAAYAVDEITSALQAVAADAAYCEATRLYIEDNLTNDDGYTAILISNDFYLSFMLKVVRSALTKATNTGIPINCGNTRLTEATAFFNGSDTFNGSNGADRVTAYSKLRAAYQNIGASACVQ
jgi:hypothetical protein